MLYEINLTDKKLLGLSKKEVSDFIAKDNIYYIGKDNEIKNLYRFQNGEDEILDNLNYNTNYYFINLNNNNFILASKNNFFFYKNDNIRINFNQKISGAEISPDKEKLMFYNSNEIWLYNLEKEERHLITRQSQKIKKAFWYPLHDYIIYATDNSLKATETDLRDGRNQTTLYNSPENINLTSLISEKYLSLTTKKEPLSVLKLLKIQN